MSKKKFYAVAKGRKTGVFRTWEECEKSISGFSCARFKSFPTQAEAEQFINAFRNSEEDKSKSNPGSGNERQAVKEEFASSSGESQELPCDRMTQITKQNCQRRTQNTRQGRKLGLLEQMKIASGRNIQAPSPPAIDLSKSNTPPSGSMLSAFLKPVKVGRHSNAQPPSIIDLTQCDPSPAVSVTAGGAAVGSNSLASQVSVSPVPPTSPLEQVTTGKAATPAPGNRYAQKRSTPSSGTIIVNPYRNSGNKRPRTSASIQQEESRTVNVESTHKKQENDQDSTEELPKGLGSFERFFAAHLRSSVKEYIEAEEDEDKALALWTTICRRLKLDVPTERIRPKYDDPNQHFAIRAALVLEESRTAISQPLKELEKRQARPSKVMLDVTVKSVDNKEGSGHHKLTFQTLNKSGYFAKEELEHLRQGVVLQCSDDEMVCILSTPKERIVKYGEVDAMVFQADSHDRFYHGSDWSLTPVGTTLINAYRQFVAVTEEPEKVPFLHSLLGHASSEAEETTSSTAVVDSNMARNEQESPEIFELGQLNASQEKATQTFLDAPPKSITVVQGPPGTGKTTLLVSVICRSLMAPSEDRRRLMVCAPTNKAITLLATRVLAAVKDWEKCSKNFILVGDEDKLLGDGQKPEASPLYPFSVFSWMKALTQEYSKIQNFFNPAVESGEGNAEGMWRLSLRLCRRLSESLRNLPDEVTSTAENLCSVLEEIKDGRAASSNTVPLTVARLLKELNKLEPFVVRKELMNSSDVVFTTLCSAGGPLVRSTPGVDSLIVDEAAAATEPELYIPFSLRPLKLLVVGDPKQLPATVLSRRAAGLGLNVSLHERLMYQCGFDDVIMLDVQYRMHPEISLFPSQQFYKGKIGNGENVIDPQRVAGKRLLLDQQPYIFLQSESKELCMNASLRNHGEAQAVVKLVRELRRRVSQNDKKWHSSDRIRIITFYRGQVALIKSLLKEVGLEKVLVATVDSSQGCEADLVIVSFVRSMNTAGFLKDDRRMNVALTRARHQLICIGNVHAMAHLPDLYSNALRLLSANAMERQVVRPVSTLENQRRALQLFDYEEEELTDVEP